jgi:ABC-2 type transport system permease protein
MRNIFLIARREYLEQIRSRAFRMSTIGLPALFALVLAIGAWSSRGAGSHKHFVVVSSNLALAEAARDRLLANKEHKPTVTVVAPITDDLRAELIEAVKDSAVSGIVSIENANGKPVASYTSKSAGDFMTASKLQSVLSDALVEERLSSAGFTPAESNTLLKGVKVESYQVKKDGAIVKSNAAASFWKGYVMAILLSMTTIIYGMNVARSIIQEKTSRIFEVMLAIAKPADMLAGKLIGVGAVGLTQILIWVVAAGALVASPLASAMLTGQFEVHFSLAEAVLFPLYFLLGYLLFSALFAGLAASCETEQELQMYMQFLNDCDDHERLELRVGRGCIAVSAHRTDRDVPAHGLRTAAAVADCALDRLACSQHLGHAVDLGKALPGWNSDVRQARHASGTRPLASVQLKSKE